MKKQILIIIFSIFILGCANTVTLKNQAGAEISFVIKLKASADTSNNKYVIVFPKLSTPELYMPFDASTENYGVLDVPWDDIIGQNDFHDTLVAIYENNELGNEPIEYYYQNYFSNWYDFVVVYGNKIRLYNGSFPLNATSTYNVDYNPAVNITYSDSSQISFTMDISELSKTYAKSEEIEFYIFTIKENAALPEDKYKLCDWSTNTTLKVINESGIVLEETSDDDLSQHTDYGVFNPLPANLDIDSWMVSIK